MTAEVERVSGNTPELFAEDRGDRTVEFRSIAEHIDFGAVVQRYQISHPDTLVRVTSSFNPRTGTGTVRVRWWQRGTRMP